jgi:hypothetical protein
MSKRKRPQSIGGQFAPRLIEMLESPAYRALSLSARRVLDRIEIELAHHGGRDNGGLPVTYDDFWRYGIDRHLIAPAIRELIALKFIEITKPGRAGNAEFQAPNLFRLTYRHTKREGPTDDWRRIATVEQAAKLARRARGSQKQNSSTGFWQDQYRNRGRNHSTKTDTTAIVQKPILLSISRGGCYRAGQMFQKIPPRCRGQFPTPTAPIPTTSKCCAYSLL